MTAVRSLLQRARPARAERDAGVTLAELTVTMLIGGVLLALVATVVVQSYRLQGKTTYRENDTTDAQIAVDTMSRALRMAVDMRSPTNQVVPAFSTTSPTEVTFTTNLDDDPSKVTYRLDGRILTQTTFRPTTAGRGKASTYPVSGATRQLSRNVVVLPGQLPLFTYFYQDGDSCPTTLPVTVPTEEPMSKVCAVQVTLTVDSDGADGQLVGTTLDALVVNQNLNKK